MVDPAVLEVMIRELIRREGKNEECYFSLT
jgi:hypothetical protein